MSRAILEAPAMRPSLSRIGDTVNEISIRLPSLRWRTRFVVIDGLAAPDARQYSRLFVHAIPRDQDGHRLADGFLGRIAEHPLGAAIPGLDDAVEILADNGVVGRLDDGREPLR